MIIVFGILAFLVGFPFVILCGWLYVNWGTHVEMTKKHCKANGYYMGTFKDFLKEFSNREWVKDQEYENSFFNKNDHYDKDNKIHASMIIFDGKYMLLYPISYIRFYFFRKKYSQKTRVNSNGKWKNAEWANEIIEDVNQRVSE